MFWVILTNDIYSRESLSQTTHKQSPKLHPKCLGEILKLFGLIISMNTDKQPPFCLFTDPVLITTSVDWSANHWANT